MAITVITITVIKIHGYNEQIIPTFSSQMDHFVT